MSALPIVRLGTVKQVERFQEHVRSLGLTIPCDRELLTGMNSPLRAPLNRGGVRIGNRITVQPMEGWDGTPDGNPSEHTIERWKKFGRSGAKLIWGGEAVAVSHEGRANPNQLVIAAHTQGGLSGLRRILIEEHRRRAGSEDGLVIGLQLTHSGRYCRPNHHTKPEPRILYHHPVLDKRLGISSDYPLLKDAEIETVIADFHRAAKLAQDLGFDFVDIKHCHGYLGHEFLSAHTREGKYGGSFENRTRFLREVVAGIRANAPGLEIGVRLSAFDTVAYRPDPSKSVNGKPGPGIPEALDHLIPYRWGLNGQALPEFPAPACRSPTSTDQGGRQQCQTPKAALRSPAPAHSHECPRRLPSKSASDFQSCRRIFPLACARSEIHAPYNRGNA